MVAGPFQILQRVEDLASELRLPNYFRIYPVILVVHLEECPDHSEEEPIIDVVGAGKRMVEKIVGKQLTSGRWHHRVKLNVGEDTWKLKDKLMTVIPTMMEDWEKNQYVGRRNKKRKRK